MFKNGKQKVVTVSDEVFNVCRYNTEDKNYIKQTPTKKRADSKTTTCIS